MREGHVKIIYKATNDNMRQTSNSHSKGDTHDGRQRGRGTQHGKTHIEGWVEEVPGHGTHVSTQETQVEGVAAGQQERSRVQYTLQLPICNQRPAVLGEELQFPGTLDQITYLL